jgi:hypothetical protein
MPLQKWSVSMFKNDERFLRALALNTWVSVTSILVTLAGIVVTIVAIHG